jgi:AcrR family transcriptional regulator
MKASPAHTAPVSPRCQQRREEILEMAIRLFARESYAELDLQVLADALNVGKGTLYRHFGSKEKLFLAAADRVMRKLREHVDTSVAGIADPLEQIRIAIHAYLKYFADHPEAVEMLIQERAQFRDRKRPTYFVHREANVERWRAVYRELIREGRVRRVPAENISDVVHSLMYGAMFASHMGGQSKTPEQTAEEIIDLVFHGILSETELRARLA